MKRTLLEKISGVHQEYWTMEIIQYEIVPQIINKVIDWKFIKGYLKVETIKKTFYFQLDKVSSFSATLDED